MKVALARFRYTAHGGAERYLDALAAALADSGAEVRLLASSWTGEAARRVALEPLSVPDRPRSARLLLFARAVADWARRHPDWLLFSLERVPESHVYRAGDGCHAEWLFRKRALRRALWPLDYVRPLNLAYLHLERALFSSPKLVAVIANSRRGREEIVRRFGLAPERISVVYNGVEGSRFAQGRKGEAASALRAKLRIADDETVFLFVGSGFLRKGVGALAEAAVILARKGARFRIVVVGKGNPGPYLRKIRREGAKGRMIFTGPVPDARDYFLGADAFVFPTIYEPFSNACLEAMAAGLPVITTVANGASEIVKEGESGFLMEDPMDATTLAEHMETLLSPETRCRMGEDARKAAGAFPLERNVRETLDCLTRAWNERRGG
jgi:UDP-glucose:(heptosyl)LPS alpha-1,3-glucosyltransferase